MTDIGESISTVEAQHACRLCGGALERVTITTVEPPRDQYHYRCQAPGCREGGVLIVDSETGRVLDHDGPSCDPDMARQYQQRTIADGGFAAEYDLQDALAEVEAAQANDDLDRLEEALLAALSKCRQQRQQRGDRRA